MSKILGGIKKFVRDEDGATMVEYALMLRSSPSSASPRSPSSVLTPMSSSGTPQLPSALPPDKPDPLTPSTWPLA